MKRKPFSRPGLPRTILLADDEAGVRMFLTYVLQDAGYRVTPVCDGRERLERFQAAPEEFDLALLDMIMPGMSGVDVLTALRVLRPDVPAIILSGDDADEVAARFRDLGLAGVLEKPFRPDDLVALIRSVLGYLERARRDPQLRYQEPA